MAGSSESAKLNPRARDAGVGARRSLFIFSFLWRGRTAPGVMGKAGMPFRPFRASGIAPSVGGATAVFFSLVVRRMKSKAKTRVGKPSDSVESEGIAPLRKPNPRRADPPGFNPFF